MDDDLGIACRLENRTMPNQLVPQGQGIGNIAVMGDSKAAGSKVRLERLDIAQRARTGGRIADMAAGRIAAQPVDHFFAVKIAGDRTKRAVAVKFLAVPAGNARCFLSAMLERMEAERNHRGCVFNPGNSKNAALFPQLVVIKRVGCQHISPGL